VEAKRVHSPLLSWAADQAIGYASETLRAIVTDGLRYGIYYRPALDAKFTLHSYLNLLRTRDHYEIYGCQGAKEAIWALMPDWRPES